MIPFLLLWFLNWRRRSFFALHGICDGRIVTRRVLLKLFIWLGNLGRDEDIDVARQRLSLQI